MEFAETYGTPIILKAAYGGGGRGMRRVDKIEDVCRKHSCNFHSNKIFRWKRHSDERFPKPNRRLETEACLWRNLSKDRDILKFSFWVGVFATFWVLYLVSLGDNHGNIVHLYERDCSVQRRHQKVVHHFFEFSRKSYCMNSVK